jgi:hypothetical protein
MYPFFFSDMNETWIFFGQIFEKYSNIKSHENPSSGSGVVPCGRKKGKTALFWFWTLEDGTIGCPETSVRSYQCLLRNSPEERSSRLLRSGRLQLRRHDEANSRTSQFCECPWKNAPQLPFLIHHATVECLAFLLRVRMPCVHYWTRRHVYLAIIYGVPYFSWQLLM